MNNGRWGVGFLDVSPGWRPLHGFTPVARARQRPLRGLTSSTAFGDHRNPPCGDSSSAPFSTDLPTGYKHGPLRGDRELLDRLPAIYDRQIFQEKCDLVWTPHLSPTVCCIGR
jgi:hypothetical protein